MNRNIRFAVIFRGQPTLCDQRFAGYGIWVFWHFFLPFWPKFRGFYGEADTKLFFDNKQYPIDTKKSHLTFIAICSTSKAIFTGLVLCKRFL